VLFAGCASIRAASRTRAIRWKIQSCVIQFNDSLDRAFANLLPGLQESDAAPGSHRVSTHQQSRYVTTIVNDALQGKLARRAVIPRAHMNSTIGIAGLFDPATAAGLEQRRGLRPDARQVGRETRPYLMPILGPSNVRDTFGRIPDQYTNRELPGRRQHRYLIAPSISRPARRPRSR
jgi:ABC-type transporter lipoprotein component MlaA